MNHLNELKKRERELRARVRKTPAAEFGHSPDDRRWIVNHLSGMQTIFELHLSTIPDGDRRFEEYRLEFLLPLYTYLSRAYAADGVPASV